MANPTPIDELAIEIDAKANDANSAIDSLCKKIDILTTSISKVDVGKLNSLGNGIKRLGDSLQTMKSIDARGVNTVVNKINSLSAIDTSKFSAVSANLHQMANGIQSLGTVSANVASVGELASNISKLGNKSVQTAVANIPQLATALNGLMAKLSQSPKVSQNVIQMTNALANLTAQGSKVGSASNSIAKGLNQTSTAAEKSKKSFKGLASTFGKFYANCFLLIRGLKGIKNAIVGTADYLEAFNYFEVALNKVGGDWAGDWEKYSKKLGVTSAEEYANSFKTRLNESLKGLSGVQISIDANGETGLLTDTGLKNLGLNIQEVTQYASQLASVTNSVGQTGEVTLATASAFTKLGADMSSLFNVDYSSVMNNLQSGLIGQSRALYKYGIDITNATLQTYAYGLGVEKAVSEMTQAEKMQLRMIAILDQSRVSWGDASNTINSLSNSIRQFKNNIKEAGMILGQLFVPILSKVMPIVNGLVIAIKRLMVSIAGLLGIELNLEEYGQGTSNISDEMDDLSDSMDNATSSAEKLKKATTTLGIDELNINSPQTDTSSGNAGGVSGGGIDLTDSILKATEEYEKAWQEAYDRMQNKAEAFADIIIESLRKTKEVAKTVGLEIQAGFEGAFKTNSLGETVENIKRIKNSIIDVFSDEEVAKSATDFASQLNRTIGAGIGGTLSSALSITNGITGGIAKASEKLKKFNKIKITSINNNMEEFFKNIEDVYNALSNVSEAFESESFEKITSFFYKLVDMTILEALDNFTGILKDLQGVLTKPLTSNQETIKEVLQNLLDIASMLLEPFDKLLDNISNGAGKYNDSWLHKLLVGLEELSTSAVGKFLESLNQKLEKIKKLIEDFPQKIEELKEKFEPLTKWFGENVTDPISEKFGVLKENIGNAFEGAKNIAEAIWKKSSEWFGENVTDRLSEKFSSVKESIGEKFNRAYQMITEKWGKLSEWFEDNVKKPIADVFSALWESLKAPLFKVLNTLSDMIEGFINSLIKGINGIIKPFNSAAKKASEYLGKDWNEISIVQEVSLPKITGYSVGGFPEDGWFRASKGEYFGQFDDGTSYIANNNQIETGIAVGVKDAVREAISEMYPYLADIAQNTRETAEKEFNLRIGDRDIGRANERYISRRGFSFTG